MEPFSELTVEESPDDDPPPPPPQLMSNKTIPPKVNKKSVNPKKSPLFITILLPFC
jgi:hypothetical protein